MDKDGKTSSSIDFSVFLNLKDSFFAMSNLILTPFLLDIVAVISHFLTKYLGNKRTFWSQDRLEVS
jgi:hypothetical protein